MIKKSIGEVPLMNEKILKETAAITNTVVQDVEEILDFVGDFIADTISDGKMVGVMIPYFGKFVPRKKVIIAKNKEKLEENSGIADVYRAISGKPDLKD